MDILDIGNNDLSLFASCESRTRLLKMARNCGRAFQMTERHELKKLNILSKIFIDTPLVRLYTWSSGAFIRPEWPCGSENVFFSPHDNYTHAMLEVSEYAYEAYRLEELFPCPCDSCSLFR